MKYLIFLCLVSINSVLAFSQSEFSKWFTNGSLRVDYILAGKADTTEILLQALRKEPFWGGSLTHLTDQVPYGEYMVRVFPKGGNELIYSRGFSTLYQEWQTTAEAKYLRRGFEGSSVIPFPKVPVRFEIWQRVRHTGWVRKFSVNVDPSDYFIQPSPPARYPVEKISVNGDPAHSVDLVFVPEGYTAGQMDKFRADILRLTDSLFRVLPFSEYRSKFNLWAVMAPSADQGADIPGNRLWVNTLVNSSYYTFDEERYLTTLDYWKLRDVAALAPCDQIYVLVNTPKYGGGGVYNHYNLTSVDNSLSPQVFIHEFGHGFAGLGDEYYTSSVAYEDFYPSDIEPWEPNLTTLVNFGAKWKDMLKPGTPVPTPATEAYIGSVGVFEGGGYVAKGVYRPETDCRMKSNEPDDFCRVCRRAITGVILSLTE